MRQSANLICSVALLLSCSAFAHRPSHPKVENAKLFIQESILKKANVEVPQELSKRHDASTKALKEKHLTQYGINLDDDHVSSNIEVHEVTKLVYSDIDTTVGAVPGWWNYVPCTQQSVTNSEATFSETYDNVTDTYHIWLGPANGCYPAFESEFAVTGWDQVEYYSGYRLAYSDRNSYNKEICWNMLVFGFNDGATSCESTVEDLVAEGGNDDVPVDYVCRARSMNDDDQLYSNQGYSEHLNCPQEGHDDFEVDEYYTVLADEPVLLSEKHEQLVITVYATAGCHEGTEIYHMAYLTNACVSYAILDAVGVIDAHYDENYESTVMINSDATYHFFLENDDSDEIGWCVERVSGHPDVNDDDYQYNVMAGHDTYGPNSKLDYCEHHGMNYGYKTTIMYEGMGVGTDDDLTTLEKVGIAAVVLGGVLAFFHVLIYAYSAVFTQNMASYKPAASTEVEMNSA